MSAINQSIVVNAPVHTVYNQWTQFEEFPRFMEGIESVQQTDDTHLRWRANIGGKEKRWDAEITEQVPDQRIAWRSTSLPNNNGLVTFQSMEDNRTQVTLQMEYEPEGVLENVGDMLGLTTRRIKGDLERFKQFIESRGAETGAWRGEAHGGQTTSAGASSTATPAATGQPGQPPAASGAAPRSSAGQSQTGAPSQQSGSQTGSEPQPARGGRERSLRALESNSPFAMMRRLFDEFDRLFAEFSGDRDLFSSSLPGAGAGSMGDWAPRVEVTERDNQLVVCAELPGVNKEDLNIEIDDQRLTIEGERRRRWEEKRRGFYAAERSYGRFYRGIPLPEGIDATQARASLNNGVLEISLPLPQRRAGARRIEVKESSSSKPTAASGSGAPAPTGLDPADDAATIMTGM